MFEAGADGAEVLAGPEGTLPFLVAPGAADEEAVGAGGEMGIFRRREEGDDAGAAVLRRLPVEVLRAGLQHAVDGVQRVVAELRVPEGGLPLKEVEVSLAVTASGQVAVLGTGAQAGATGTITLTFGA